MVLGENLILLLSEGIQFKWKHKLFSKQHTLIKTDWQQQRKTSSSDRNACAHTLACMHTCACSQTHTKYTCTQKDARRCTLIPTLCVYMYMQHNSERERQTDRQTERYAVCFTLTNVCMRSRTHPRTCTHRQTHTHTYTLFLSLSLSLIQLHSQSHRSHMVLSNLT